MSVVKAGPAVPNWLAAGLIGVVLGFPGGYYTANWNSKPAGAAQAGGGMGGGMGGMMGRGGMGGGGMMGGGGGGGGAQDHPQAASLVRTVGALATLEKARGKELTAEQRSKVAAVAATLKTDAALTEEQCEAKLKELNAAMNSDQQQVLQDMMPRGRGGGGGGPGGGRGGLVAASGPGGGANAPAGNRPANGPGGGMGGGMGGMGGGPAMDWEHPFKEGRGHDRLEELLDLLKSPSG